MEDKKFIYNDKVGFKILPSFTLSHSKFIDKGYFNATVRGIILEKEKIIYLRINPKRYRTYPYLLNYVTCVIYLNEKYSDYTFYDSYSINKLPERTQKYLLGA